MDVGNIVISFVNEGTLDVRAITTFGVSSKEGENNIGYFGTGLKYSIAILLREGLNVEIITGGKRHTFEAISETIRVNEFQTVWMTTHHDNEAESQRLAFTTELGKTWDLWQAYRELWSNCRDEGGSIRESTGDEGPPVLDGHTYVNVRGARFDDIHKNRYQEVLCPNKNVVYDDEYICRVLSGGSQRVYYRGIRAAELKKPALYTYDILASMQLTEDRSFKYDFLVRSTVGAAIAQSDNEELLTRILLAEDGTFEAGIDFTLAPDCASGPIFKDLVRKLAGEYPTQINQTAMQAVDISVADLLPQETKAGTLNAMDTARLNRAAKFCERIGFPVDDYPIIVVPNIDNGVLGLAKNGNIYISRLAFEQGTKVLVGTLIEEYIHLSRNVGDYTREMQNILVDNIVTLGEQATGEML